MFGTVLARVVQGVYKCEGWDPIWGYVAGAYQLINTELRTQNKVATKTVFAKEGNMIQSGLMEVSDWHQANGD